MSITTLRSEERPKRSWKLRVVLWACALAPLAMMVSYASAWIDPRWVTWPQFSSLAYPIILIANILVLIPLFFKAKKQFLITLVILLLGSKLHYSYFTLPLSDDESSNSVKVLSFNVRNFDRYEWSENEGTGERIMSFITDQDADVICLQEFYLDTREGGINTLDTLRSLMPGLNFRLHLTHEFTGQFLGLATLSRLPIVGSGEINFSSDPNNACMWTDLVKGTDTIRVFNMHLGSIGFQQADYEWLGAAKENEGPDGKGDEASIVPRLSTAFEKRAEQCRVLLEHVKASPYPCFVSGDLNDTPASNAYWTLRSELDDAFVGSTWGNQRTYIGKFPNYRIDYILHSEEFSSGEFETHYVDLSDHYPITCELGL